MGQAQDLVIGPGWDRLKLADKWIIRQDYPSIKSLMTYCLVNKRSGMRYPIGFRVIYRFFTGNLQDWVNFLVELDSGERILLHKKKIILILSEAGLRGNSQKHAWRFLTEMPAREPESLDVLARDQYENYMSTQYHPGYNPGLRHSTIVAWGKSLKIPVGDQKYELSEGYQRFHCPGCQEQLEVRAIWISRPLLGNSSSEKIPLLFEFSCETCRKGFVLSFSIPGRVHDYARPQEVYCGEGFLSRKFPRDPLSQILIHTKHGNLPLHRQMPAPCCTHCYGEMEAAKVWHDLYKDPSETARLVMCYKCMRCGNTEALKFVVPRQLSLLPITSHLV